MGTKRCPLEPETVFTTGQAALAAWSWKSLPAGYPGVHHGFVLGRAEYALDVLLAEPAHDVAAIVIEQAADLAVLAEHHHDAVGSGHQEIKVRPPELGHPGGLALGVDDVGQRHVDQAHAVRVRCRPGGRGDGSEAGGDAGVARKLVIGKAGIDSRSWATTNLSQVAVAPSLKVLTGKIWFPRKSAARASSPAAPACRELSDFPVLNRPAREPGDLP